MNGSAMLTPTVSERDHIAGESRARLTLVEFGDYQCPYCGAAYPVVKQLQRDFGDELRFVFRNFPLTQAHPYAMIAAEAAEAAALQGKFWEMHDIIYENQDELEPDILLRWVQEIQLDTVAFGKAIRQGTIPERIKEDRKSGIRSGVNGTPCFFINGARFDANADYESLREALNR
jgi:protein-disulfide isomerase